MKNEPSPNDALPRTLVERVLERLGFESRPAADREGLAHLYAAWCRSVPFDNTRKLTALRAGRSGPLPGDSPQRFLEGWLVDGAGGTCWAMHGAWTEILRAFGFRAERGIATMLVAPDLPPNHGTTSAQIEGEIFLVDACIQHGEPLLLDPHRETGILHPAHGVHVRPQDGKWLLRWRSPFAPGSMDCRIDSLASDATEFRAYHESTRSWSPFNYQLFARVHRNGGILLAVRGERVEIDEWGTESRSPLAGEDRLRFLIEDLGLEERFARAVPQDVAMPPPPGSATAHAAGGSTPSTRGGRKPAQP